MKQIQAESSLSPPPSLEQTDKMQEPLQQSSNGGREEPRGLFRLLLLLLLLLPKSDSTTETPFCLHQAPRGAHRDSFLKIKLFFSK